MSLEPSTPFEYPDEPDESATVTGNTCGEGFRMALVLVMTARGAHARNVRLEVVDWIVTRSNETTGDLAKRLGVSREHVSREIARIRKWNLPV